MHASIFKWEWKLFDLSIITDVFFFSQLFLELLSDVSPGEEAVLVIDEVLLVPEDSATKGKDACESGKLLTLRDVRNEWAIDDDFFGWRDVWHDDFLSKWDRASRTRNSQEETRVQQEVCKQMKDVSKRSRCTSRNTQRGPVMSVMAIVITTVLSVVVDDDDCISMCCIPTVLPV